jgi:hypothetical protein
MSQVIDLCEDSNSDDNGEWTNTNTNTASVPSLPGTKKGARDTEESSNYGNPRNENGPGNKNATVSSTIEELKENSNVSVSQPTITRIAELMQVLRKFLTVSSTIEELKENSNVSVSQPTITRIAEIMQVLRKFFDDPGSVPVEPDLLGAVKDLRRLLSVERNPPVDPIVDAGALPYFVALLTNNKYPIFQFEAVWVLTKIASTNRTKDVANCDNAVRSLVELLDSPVPEVREVAVMCLGYIAGESVTFRDGILRESGLIEGM